MHRKDFLAVVSTRWLALPLVVLLTIGAAASIAQASDASLKHALKGYENRLTADIGYLASFTAPSKSGAAGALKKLSTISKQLKGATQAANGQQASSAKGTKGRKDVLAALKDASAAVTAAKASANAAKAGNSSTAKHDAKQERQKINKAIPLFEAGGKALGLFS
jgi:hypothetical protein